MVPGQMADLPVVADRERDTTARVAWRVSAGAVVALAAAAGVLLLAGAAPARGDATRADRLSWRVDASPFRLVVLEGDDVLVAHALAPLSRDAGRRLGYRLDDGTYHAATRLLTRQRTAGGERFTLATDEPGRTIRLDVRRSGRGVGVSWAPVPDSDVAVVYESFSASGSDHFLGSGQRDRWVDLRGTMVPLKVWNECRTNFPVPFVLSSAGWGLRLATSGVGRLGFPLAVDGPAFHCELGTSTCPLASRVAAVQACVKARRLDYELYAGSPEQIVRLHSAAIGRPPLPPRSQFALIKWRDSVSREEELDDDVRQLRGRGIPLGWILLDNPWESHACIGSLEFDRDRFPDPAATIRRLHGLGVRFMLWVSPYLESGCPRGQYASGAIVGAGELQAIDLTDPQARAHYEERLRALFALGVDGVKGDRGDEVDLEQTPLAGGSGTALHNVYARLFAQSVMTAMRRAGRAGVATMFRSGAVGTQRVLPGVWAGDQHGTFDGLRAAVRMGQTAGVSGYPFWGSDVGGYGLEPRLTAEVFARWTQLGAISPILEVGGEGQNSRFWELGPTAVEAMRRSAILHYELHPYHYELARRAVATGVPILRPLAFHYPEDEKAWNAELQLLVGRDLLAAPVTDPGTRARVYLPAGAWVDLGRGTTHRGPGVFVRRTPLLELPLYLRSGSAIPFDLRLPIWSQPWGLNDLSRPGRAGWLVAPGEVPFTARSTDYGAIAVAPTGSGLELRLRDTRREVQVVVLGAQGTTSVRADGRRLRQARSQEALRGRAQGWVSRPAPYRGLVLKLAPRRGAATVTIDAG
jgi:alpha-D-xyloside xylohydrolase